MLKKSFLLVMIFCLMGLLSAQQWDVKTGLGYSFYGFHAEKGSVKLDSQYEMGGLDLGGIFHATENWDIHGGFFLGLPLAAAVYVNGELYSEPNLSTYDYSCYYLSFSLAPAYRMTRGDFSFSVGPLISSDNLVLASLDNDPAYVFSYTLGVGVLTHFEYAFSQFTLYADLKGTGNFAELLVNHDDFDYAYEGTLSLGALWRLK